VVNCCWFLIGTTNKNQQKKIVHETVNFCSPNLTKSKKKSKNTTNCHNVFIILLFSTVVSFITNSSWQVVIDFKINPWLTLLFYPLVVAYLWFFVKLMWKCCELSIFLIWSIKNWDLGNCENILITTSVTTFLQNIYFQVVGHSLIFYYFILTYKKLTLQ